MKTPDTRTQQWTYSCAGRSRSRWRRRFYATLLGFDCSPSLRRENSGAALRKLSYSLAAGGPCSHTGGNDPRHPILETYEPDRSHFDGSAPARAPVFFPCALHVAPNVPPIVRKISDRPSAPQFHFVRSKPQSAFLSGADVAQIVSHLAHRVLRAAELDRSHRMFVSALRCIFHFVRRFPEWSRKRSGPGLYRVPVRSGGEAPLANVSIECSRR